MNYKQALNELYSLDTPKFKLGLQNIKLLLKELNNPEKKLKCIHVAGTNGKGSVCAMLNSILSNAGYKVGMYTSPHLKKFNERIRINNKLITDKEIVKYYLKIKNCRTNCSFFEITTAMAFLYFKEKKVDFAVLETGLGGRLDATNVIKPLISIITNIGIEHTAYLGKSLNKVASEKAGIIKKNIPIVTAAQGSALSTIEKISNKKNSKLIIINNKKLIKHFKNNNWSFVVNNHVNLKLNNLKGKFQVINAALAVSAIDLIKGFNNVKISNENIKNGLKNAKWPGRFQFINKNTLIDSAHNPLGFQILIKELKNLKYQKLILVVGFSDDKDIKTISKIIKPFADKIIITKSNNERAENPETIKTFFNKNSIIMKNPKKALKYAKNIATKKDLILITGSIFLVGELI